MSTQDRQGFWISLEAYNLEKTYFDIFSISLCTNLTKSENYAVLKTTRKHTCSSNKGAQTTLPMSYLFIKKQQKKKETQKASDHP